MVDHNAKSRRHGVRVSLSASAAGESSEDSTGEFNSHRATRIRLAGEHEVVDEDKRDRQKHADEADDQPHEQE